MKRAIKAVLLTACLAGAVGFYGNTLASDRIIPTGPEVELGSVAPLAEEETAEESVTETMKETMTESTTENSMESVSETVSVSPIPRAADEAAEIQETEKQEGETVAETQTGKLIEVPYINQSGDWPTGCESVSTVMLLRFLGIDVDVDTFIEKYLPAEDMEYSNNTIYGPDPRKAFAGSPYDENSFGCYTGVIIEAIQRCIASQKQKKPEWEAVDLTDLPMETILSDYIDQGMPVIFWATIDMRPSQRGPSWTIKDSGGTFIWTSNEHCMLLVGYDDDKYYFNDPWNNNGCIGYEKSLVEERHREMFNMAVGMKK